MSTVCISTIIISKTAEAGIIRDQKLISVLKNHRSWPIKITYSQMTSVGYLELIHAIVDDVY